MALNSLMYDFGLAAKPFEGESVSGDISIIRESEKHIFLAVIDVAGHGKKAAQLANTIKTFLDGHFELPLKELIEKLHEHIRGTRGCAGSFFKISKTKSELEYIGVGNTVAKIIGMVTKTFVSRSGIIGYIMPSLHGQKLILKDSDILLCYSDGIQGTVNDEFSKLKNLKLAQDIAETIINKFGKAFDDSICAVLKK